MKQQLCPNCARTGLLSATVAKHPETGERCVAVCVCDHPSHTKPDLAWRNVESIMAETKLPVVVVDAPLRPFDWNDAQEQAAVSAA